MARVTYVQPDGTEDVIDVPLGQSMMRGAVLNGVEGIVAQCGGGASCGTCHVVVEDAGHPLPGMHPVENELLFGTAVPRQAGSRLSCQIESAPELDGLRLHVPERQL